MSVPVLPNALARRLFLHKHLLAEAPEGPADGAALTSLVERLGFIQVDSINTVARAHDLIVHTRRPRYRAGGLARHLERNRALFEHWTHDAALIPMSFYPYWRLKQRRDAARMLERYRSWREGDFEVEFDRVRAHIEMHGACGSGELGTREKKSSGGWWDWHPAKTALEYLWRKGELEICHRKSFAKYYDLSHRVIPLEVAERDVTEAASVDWFCQGALDRLGFATTGEIADFWDIVTKREARDWAEAADLIEIDVEGHDGALRRHLARRDVFDAAEAAPAPPNRLRVLSPFDPALRDRKRAERLFGFHYRIEVFVPEAKRQYGYYVFPLLERDRLVGRIDMKADRKAGRLKVTALWPEAGMRWGQGRQDRLAAELGRIARLANVEEVVWASDFLKAPIVKDSS
ncbi:winged helix-turn-helix domain-containing protein [Primorskyibacter sp. S187A]|uniref:winged helix-turn-helix domain-containing protein n=1 Tax=Primorskyibacter sp. S187A TaxID=3415130 RepID=UPI003C7B1A91